MSKRPRFEFLFITIFYLFITIQNTAEPLEPNNENLNKEKSNWSLRYSYGFGNGPVRGNIETNQNNTAAPSLPFNFSLPNTNQLTNKSKNSSFYAEYSSPSSSFGYILGMSVNQFDLKIQPGPAEYLTPLLIINLTGNLINQLQPILGDSATTTFRNSINQALFNTLPQEEFVSYLGGTLDFGVNYSIYPMGMWEPMVQVVLGLGTVGKGTFLTKGEFSLGMRGNFSDSMYFGLEGYKSLHGIQFAIGGGKSNDLRIEDTGLRIYGGFRL